MEKVMIRRASEKDRAAISRIIAYGFREDFCHLTNDLERVSNALMSGYEINRFFVADEDGKILGVIACSDCNGRAASVSAREYTSKLGLIRGLLGFFVLKSEFTAPLKYPETTGYIEFVAVAEDARRRGVASAMLKGVAEQTDYSSYILEVTEINLSAQECYKKFGFKEIHRVREKLAMVMGYKERIVMEYFKQ